jgi:hypothetical protein
MQEIRFSQPAPQIPEVAPEKAPTKKKDSLTTRSFLLIVKVLIVLAVLYGGLVVSKYFLKPDQLANDYVAVFLANGQVYFGKFDKKNEDELVMKEVYYLQNTNNGLYSSTSGELPKTGFTLVKLGQEIHGPEDFMYINKSQVLFYEYLRADSQLVETIKNYKK